MGCSVYSNVYLIKNLGYNDCKYVLAFYFYSYSIAYLPDLLHIDTKSVWENSIKDSSLSVFFHETHTQSLVSGPSAPTQQMQVSGGGSLTCAPAAQHGKSPLHVEPMVVLKLLQLYRFDVQRKSAHLSWLVYKCFDCSITHHCCRSESWGSGAACLLLYVSFLVV